MATLLAAPFFISTPGEEADVIDTSDLDFSRYDAYLDDLGVLYLQDGQTRKASQTLPLQPPRTDIGQSEFETRPEFGDFFTQGDFSHGQGQKFYHREGRNERKYWYGYGFDISEPGVLRHLNDTARAHSAGALTVAKKLVEFDSLPFVFEDQSVWRGPATFPDTWTEENPHDGETAVEILDLTTSGGHLYAAMGAGGIHRRDTAAAWDAWVTGTVTIVSWAKDRLFAASDRIIYEVTAGGALPTALDTLAEDWEFTCIWENGPFILASAVNESAGLSRVYAYGLNEAGDALERKTSSALPKGELIHCGIHALGRTFLGGGRMEVDTTESPILYEAQVGTTGDLQFLLIANSEDVEGMVADFEVTPDSILFPWQDEIRGSGLARYHLGRNAFSIDLSPNNPPADENVDSVLLYRGTVMMTAGAVYYEKVGTAVNEAILMTSVADWNNVGDKTWDLFQIAHNELVIGSGYDIDYTRKDPEVDEWLDAFENTLPGSTGADERITDIRTKQLALKITSTGSGGHTPELFSYSVRSTPSPAATEWQLIRTVRVLDRDRKDKRAQPLLQDPREVRNDLEDLAYHWVTLYEPGQTWTAYVQSMTEIEPDVSPVSETGGTAGREVYYVELRMIGRRAT